MEDDELVDVLREVVDESTVPDRVREAARQAWHLRPPAGALVLPVVRDSADRALPRHL